MKLKIAYRYLIIGNNHMNYYCGIYGNMLTSNIIVTEIDQDL